MVFVWCRVQVSAWDRRRTLAILQKDLADKPLVVRSHVLRINAEIASDRRAMSKARANWLNTKDKMV